MNETNRIVTVSVGAGVATVTLNRPDALNALSRAMRSAIAEAFAELRSREDVRVIILTGAGRAFTAGLDLKELGQSGFDSSPEGVTAEDLEDAIRSVGKPVIGAINGFAITGGFEIALMCDILVASTEAKFADTHVRMGVVPGWGLSQRLSRLIGASRAKELSLTGNYLDAETAERWGLVNHVLPPADLMPFASNSHGISVAPILRPRGRCTGSLILAGSTPSLKGWPRNPAPVWRTRTTCRLNCSKRVAVRYSRGEEN